VGTAISMRRVERVGSIRDEGRPASEAVSEASIDRLSPGPLRLVDSTLGESRSAGPRPSASTRRGYPFSRRFLDIPGNQSSNASLASLNGDIARQRPPLTQETLTGRRRSAARAEELGSEMAEPSEEQRAEAQRLVDGHADAARADRHPIDERYTARARLLRTGALEVVLDPPADVERSYLIDREGRVGPEPKSRRWWRLSIGGAFGWIGFFLLFGGFAGCTTAGKFAEGETRDKIFWISAGVAAIGFLIARSGDALDGAKRKRAERETRDPGRWGDWFDIPPTRRSFDPLSQPDSERRRIHPLEVMEDLSQSDDDGSFDLGDDGDSD